jgi:hypothetical protein
MKIIEATWEKRNLGKYVLEVEIENSDQIDAVRDDLNRLTADYIVLKIPCSLGEFIQPIQAIGFKFMEVLTHSIFDSNLPALSPIEEKFLNNIRSEQISALNGQLLDSAIAQGMFNTDRISLDPKFMRGLSGNRYLGMLQDERARGATIYQITYKEDFVGFYILRFLNETTSYSSIGGIIPKYQNKGLGILMNYLQIRQSYELGAREVLSTFSSNNVAATHIHWKYKYRLARQEAIFVKHGD